MKKFLPHLLVAGALFFVGHAVVFAQGGACDPATGGGCSKGITTTIPNPFSCAGSADASGGCTLSTFLNTIIQNIILPLGGVLIVLAFIWVGFMYVKARGKPGDIETANRALLYVAIGTAVLLGSTLISSLVSNTLDKLK